MSQAYHQHFSKLRRSAPKADLHQRAGLDSSAVLLRGVDVKKQKQAAKIWIVVAGGFFIASAFGLLSDEDFASTIPQLNWSWVTEGYATDSVLGADKKKQPTENAMGNQAQPSLEASNNSPKEPAESSALGPLIELQSRLKQKEAELNALEQELSRKEKALAEQLSELQKIRDEISNKVQKTIQESDKTVDQLVEVYSAMKPAQAAEVLGQLQDELATKILSRMKKKTAAEIMGFLKPEKAKSLTERIAGFTSP